MGEKTCTGHPVRLVEGFDLVKRAECSACGKIVKLRRDMTFYRHTVSDKEAKEKGE